MRLDDPDSQDPKTDSPLEQMLHHIFRAIQSSTGMEQYAQFSRLTCECLQCVRSTGRSSSLTRRHVYIYRLQTPPPYTNITDYLAFRCYNSGGYFGLALARYTLDIYLSDDELQSPLVAECERLTLGERFQPTLYIG